MTNRNGSASNGRRATEAEARRKHLTLTGGLIAVTSIVYLGVVLFTSRDLPGTMAIHFDLAGRPNGFMATPMALLVQSLAVIGLPLALLLVSGVGQWWAGENARAFSATIVGLSAGLTTLFVSQTLANVGVTDSSRVTLSGGTALLALGVGVVVGLLATLVLPKPLPRPAAEPIVPMKLGPSDRVSWFGKAHAGHSELAVVGIAILLVAVAAFGTGLVWMWLMVVAVVALMFGMTSFSVTIDSRGVSWRAGLGVPRGLVRLADITAVAVIKVGPGDFGGYGMRALPGRLGLITRSGSALQVTHGKRQLVITVDDAYTAASVIEGLRGR